MSSDNSDISSVVKDVATGTTKAVLEYSEDKIKEFVRKFRDRKLSFINEPSTIELVKEQIRNSEFKLASKYVKDRELQLIVQMGLALRELEKKGDMGKVIELKDDIHAKFKGWGVHAAQAVQTGILMSMLEFFIDNIKDETELSITIEDILINIDKLVIYVQEDHTVPFLIKKIETILFSHNPQAMLLCSKYSANKVMEKLIVNLEPELFEYEMDIKRHKNTIYVALERKRGFC